MHRLIQRAGLLRGLLGGDTVPVGPIYVDIDVTRRCNLQCTACPYHSPPVQSRDYGDPSFRDIAPELVERVCRELRRMGTRTLVLQGGGEPLTHPAFLDLVGIAKGAGHHVTVLTNGTLLDETMAQGIIGRGLDQLRVTLWASSPEEYRLNYLGADPANFTRVVDGLARIAEVKRLQRVRQPKVQVHFVLTRHNCARVFEHVELARRAGCQVVTFAPVHNNGDDTGDARMDDRQKRQLGEDLDEAGRRLRALGIPTNASLAAKRLRAEGQVWRALPCYAPWYHLRIRTDGSVLACGRLAQSLALGNVRSEPLGDIWNGEPARAFRRRTSTAEGIQALVAEGLSDCSYCCHLENNLRVHRMFRRFRPLAALARWGTAKGDGP